MLKIRVNDLINIEKQCQFLCARKVQKMSTRSVVDPDPTISFHRKFYSIVHKNSCMNEELIFVLKSLIVNTGIQGF